MDCNCPFLIRRYSTFRNDLPSLVWQRYFTKASSGPVAIRSRSKCPMKSICVSQHRVLKVLLLMWSSPAALEKVKLSASRLSTGPQSFFSQAAYHFRTISSFVKFCPLHALALAGRGRLRAPTSAQAPVASRFLRDTAILVIVRSPFEGCSLKRSPDREADCPSIRTGWYLPVSPFVRLDAIRLACGCPAGAETSASPRYFGSPPLSLSDPEHSLPTSHSLRPSQSVGRRRQWVPRCGERFRGSGPFAKRRRWPRARHRRLSPAASGIPRQEETFPAPDCSVDSRRRHPWAERIDLEQCRSKC